MKKGLLNFRVVTERFYGYCELIGWKYLLKRPSDGIITFEYDYKDSRFEVNRIKFQSFAINNKESVINLN